MVAATCSALNAGAATITSTWLGGSGAWEDPTQWSAGVPQNNASDTYTAAIDGSNPAASQVTLSSAVTVDSLRVGAGDQLQISNALTISGSSIRNDGLLIGSFLSGSSGAPVTLSGRGTVQLQGGSLGSMINQGNTIAGWGRLSDENGSFTIEEDAAATINATSEHTTQS
jgi:hypothetical protein